jgi:hypothetical protein
MSRVNKDKSKQLGMPFGTAQNRLRKKMLFHLVCRLNENICHRCNKEIETAKELSMEHIKPWLHEDANLFWDIKNITFSHHKCNSGSRRNTHRMSEAAKRVWQKRKQLKKEIK